MKKKLAVAALSGVFSLAAFAQASNSQVASAQAAPTAPTPMVKQAAMPAENHDADGMKMHSKHHHRHHHHHKAAMSNASES
ncbi:hypothetical protein [Burkholderia latens]|uniref:Uncharacterized protein n=1 Tax=Burkholderia latens TaxID=488446 RepID=A0A6H9SU31_9BURK|nr:hypothetical protein [Burkholderia latens]KAB0644839.1 hypothetical protein F7R21_00605 [Burkholderia latens]VWB16296.1 hypothetical protein BLA24064_00593 [Burkholderia latens]